jgi:hypothetical protein
MNLCAMTSTVAFADLPPGYPKLAALISKDKDYAVFRKFSSLNARNILYLQSELTDLEAQLERTDNGLKLTDEKCLRSRDDFCSSQDRASLVKKIRKTLYLYSTAGSLLNMTVTTSTNQSLMAQILLSALMMLY